MTDSKEVIKNLILDYIKNEHYVRDNTIQVYWTYRDAIEDVTTLEEICDVGMRNGVETFDDAMIDYMCENDWDIDQWHYIFENFDIDSYVQEALENGDISEEDYEYYESLDYADVQEIVTDNINLDMDPNHFNCDVIITLRFDGQYSENYLNRIISDSDDAKDFYTFDEDGYLSSTDSYYYVVFDTDAYKFYELYRHYHTNGRNMTDQIVLTNCDIAIGDEDNVVASNKTVTLNKKLMRELDEIDTRMN